MTLDVLLLLGDVALLGVGERQRVACPCHPYEEEAALFGYLLGVAYGKVGGVVALFYACDVDLIELRPFGSVDRHKLDFGSCVLLLTVICHEVDLFQIAGERVAFLVAEVVYAGE